MPALTPTSPLRHLRVRGEAGSQPTTSVDWFDPASTAVRTVFTGVMLASLLMAAALPDALGDHGALFAASYVVLQVGRNAAAMSFLDRDHRLREVFERLLA